MQVIRLRALVWRHNRIVRGCLAAMLGAAALVSWLAAEDRPATRQVTVAARDLESGATLTEQDLTTAPDSLGLATASPREAAGRRLRGPVAAGEPVTDSRLVPSGAVRPAEGRVVFPLQISDERIAALLHSGDRVDVLSAPGLTEGGSTRTLARSVEVLTVPAATRSGPFGGSAVGESGAIVLLSVERQVANDLAAAKPTDHVTLAIR